MISIIITNYNKSSYLLKNLERCRDQFYQKFEVIFFDDNSTDNSIKIVKKFIKKNKKLKIRILIRKGKKFTNNCYNQMSAINYCTKYASGEYISLLDADDFFLKSKLKILNNAISKTKKKILYNSYSILKNKKYFPNRRHFLKRKFIWPIFPPTSCITVEKKLFKEALKKISFKKYPTCWLDFRLAVYFSKYYSQEIIYLKKKLTIYRKNEEGNDSNYTNIFFYSYWKRKLEAIILNIII